MQDFQNTPYICWQLLESRGTHSGAMQLFKELVLEGEDTVLQDQFQELHYLILFKTNGVPSEGATILMLGLRVLNMFTEQPVDDVQGCGDWDAGEESRDIKGD